MEEKGSLKEGKVFGEEIIYEFRIGSPDIEAIEAFGKLLQHTSENEKKKGYEVVFSNIAAMLKYPEVWHIFSAGLRKPIEECKKIRPQKKLIKILPEILEVNKHFFSETPEMLGQIHRVMIPKVTKEEEKMVRSILLREKESNSSKKTS